MGPGPSWETNSTTAVQELPNTSYDPEGSLPCSQEPATDLYPKPGDSRPYPFILFV
jgi:hypothetical protein